MFDRVVGSWNKRSLEYTSSFHRRSSIRMPHLLPRVCVQYYNIMWNTITYYGTYICNYINIYVYFFIYRFCYMIKRLYYFLKFYNSPRKTCSFHRESINQYVEKPPKYTVWCASTKKPPGICIVHYLMVISYYAKINKRLLFHYVKKFSTKYVFIFFIH